MSNQAKASSVTRPESKPPNRPATETAMQPPDLNWIANFIWGIADDVLRDLYVRGKYRDVILPMTVLRRLDAVIEPRK
jgi:type I restriction enzyme M protein